MPPPAEAQSLMAKEIAEAGDAVERFLASNARALDKIGRRLRATPPPVVATIARGSSDHCALYLKYLVEIELGAPCASIGPSIATLYHAPLKLQRALAVSISQSGRSPDIVTMQRAARRAGALTLAIVNDIASPLAVEAERLLPLEAGLEQSVAATKSMIAGLVAAASLVAAWSQNRPLAEALGRLPDILRASDAPAPQAFVDRLAAARSAFVIGRGATFAVAAEAALKLKETCGIHAEAFSAAEVLHGPAELIRSGFPVIAFAPQDEARAGFVETTARLKTMGADILCVDVAREGGPPALATADPCHPYLAPIPMIHRFYRVAEATALALGRDPDAPRNLRKITRTV